jgi:hypothetical protein
VSESRLSRQERRALERARAKAEADQPYISKLYPPEEALAPGSVTIALVGHDDWCPKLVGGLCRCNPDVVYERIGGDEA